MISCPFLCDLESMASLFKKMAVFTDIQWAVAITNRADKGPKEGAAAN